MSCEMSSPSRSSEPSAGRRPIGVSRTSAVPSMRPTIHSSTRELSPKPGQRNEPSWPLRNQLTWKIFGAFVPRMRPIFTQWPQ